MWRNYMTVGLRALMKNRTYAFINIVGLAIGLAACLMLLLYVRYERSYDAWLPKAGNVYQVQSHFRDPETGEEGHLQMSPYVAGTRLRQDYRQIEASVYALNASPVVVRNNTTWLIQDAIKAKTSRYKARVGRDTVDTKDTNSNQGDFAYSDAMNFGGPVRWNCGACANRMAHGDGEQACHK